MLRHVRTEVQLRARVEQLLAEAMGRATKILSSRRDDLLRLAEALRERRRLGGDDVREIIEGQPRLRLVQP